MAPIFNLRGFRSYDSLDDVTGIQRALITSIVGILISIGFLSLVFGPLHIAALRLDWLMYAEAIAIGLIYVPIVTALRKSSSLLPIILMLVAMYPVDFFVQAHYRDVSSLSSLALWSYNADGLLGSIPSMLQFLIVYIVYGFLAGCVTLWVSRMIAQMLVRTKSASSVMRGATPVPEDQYKKFFKPEWVDEPVAKPKRDFGFVILRASGLIYVAYLFLLLLGSLGQTPLPSVLQPLVQMTYQNKILAVNTFIKIILMMSLAMIGAYNVKLRFHATITLLFGHLVSVTMSLFFYFYEAGTAPYHQFLLESAILDFVLVIFFVYVVIKNKSEADDYRIQKQFPEFYSLANRLSVLAFYALGCFTAAMVLGILYCRLFTDGQSGLGAAYGFPDPQLCNTLTKYSTLSFLSFMLARRESLRNKLYSVLTGSYMVSVFTSICAIAIGGLIHPVEIITRNGGTAQIDWYFMLIVAVDSVILAVLVALRRMYYNVEYTIVALSPAGADNVIAYYGALHGDDPEVGAIVCQAVDAQAADMVGRKRGLVNIPFALVEFLPIILGIRSKFSAMSVDNRKYFLRNTIMRQPLEQQLAFMPDVAKTFFELGTATDALVTLAYYSGARGHQETGFIPPDARDRMQSDIAMTPPPFVKAAKLPDGPNSLLNWKPPTIPSDAKLVAPRVVTAIGDKAIPDEVDYLIIGSGAGGAVMAYKLICGEPNAKILVVERGPRYSPLQDFNDHEMEMVCKLYKEGGLQQTKRFDLIVLQGECMGGTTVINNAACLKMPQSVKDIWQNDYDIDLSSLESHYDAIKEEIDIYEIDTNAVNTKVAEVFRKGVTPLIGADARLGNIENLMTNHINQQGDGSDNLGNKRMRKRSMLETYIPWAEERGVQFVPETSAVRFMSNGRRVDKIMLRSDLGHLFNVKVRKAAVIAGGVISSSQFLMRSGLMKNVGERMACNLAFPATFKFAEELKSYDGVQITLGALDKETWAIFETYSNPPGAFALSLPFFFDEQIKIMQSYPNMVNFGALVGSEPNGTIDPAADILDGRAFTWSLGKTDIEHIKYAFQTLARIGQFAGAQQIILPTYPGIKLDLSKSDEVDRFCKSLDAFPLAQDDLHLATAHPQGGNGMAGDKSPYVNGRVVDGDFRVSGFDNLYVADASLFPTGITVNPQWTIMAMSSMASEKVLANSSSGIAGARASSSAAPQPALHSDFSLPKMFPWLLGMKRKISKR